MVPIESPENSIHVGYLGSDCAGNFISLYRSERHSSSFVSELILLWIRVLPLPCTPNFEVG